jgi:hypothetical protein
MANACCSTVYSKLERLHCLWLFKSRLQTPKIATVILQYSLATKYGSDKCFSCPQCPVPFKLEVVVLPQLHSKPQYGLNNHSRHILLVLFQLIRRFKRTKVYRVCQFSNNPKKLMSLIATAKMCYQKRYTWCSMAESI